MTDWLHMAIVAVVAGFVAAVLTWLLRAPDPHAVGIPCAESCGDGWRGVEFAGGCACVQEVR